MKDYSNGDSSKKFVTKIDKVSNDVFDIYYADGTVMRNVQLSRKNFNLLVKKQEEQAKEGVEKIPEFKKLKTKAGIATGLTSAGVVIGASALTFIPAINEFASQSPLVVASGIGLITILGSIKPAMKLIKNSAIIKELEKIKYRNDHMEKLSSFREHPTALTGLNSYVSKHFESSRKPLSIYHIDKYDIEDLQLIIENLDKEAELASLFGEEIVTVEPEKKSKGPKVKQQ